MEEDNDAVLAGEHGRLPIDELSEFQQGNKVQERQNMVYCSDHDSQLSNYEEGADQDPFKHAINIKQNVFQKKNPIQNVIKPKVTPKIPQNQTTASL